MSGRPWQGVIEEYREHLPVSSSTPVVSLLEGGTPLIEARRLSEQVGAKVWLKVEGANPTGSFKDRGMTVAISKALEEGAKAVVCGSTGNTSASAAAYAARAGLACVVLIPDGYIALGKLAQALVHGAKVVQVRGNFDRALALVRELAEKEPVTVVNSINPYRIEGQKTGAFEVVDILGEAPDVHCMPVGNAGNIVAYWKGYREYQDAGRLRHLHAMYVGGVTQNVDHFKRASFLPLNSIGVYGVHNSHRFFFRQLTHERQRAVEISPYLHDFCAVNERLGELA